MSHEFRKPGYDKEIAPEANLAKDIHRTVERGDALLGKLREMETKITEATEVIKAIEESLEQEGERLSAEDREQLESILARHDVALAHLEDDFTQMLRDVLEADEKIKELNDLRGRFTTSGGQA